MIEKLLSIKRNYIENAINARNELKLASIVKKMQDVTENYLFVKLCRNHHL